VGWLLKTTHSWDCNEGPGDSLYDSTGTNDGTPAISTSDLVTNGDFEDRGADDFDDWTEYHGDGDSYVSANTLDPHGGAVCAEVMSGNGDAYASIRTAVPTDIVGTLTFWMKSTGAATNVQVYGGLGGYLNNAVEAQTSWTEHEIPDFIIGDSYIRFAPIANTDVPILFDDVSFVRTGPNVSSTEGPEIAKILDSISTNHGTPVNMDVSNVSDDVPAALAGTGVKSLSFDGTEEYVVVDDSLTETIYNAGQVTLSFWANLDDDTADHRVVGTFGSSADDRQIWCWFDKDGDGKGWVASAKGRSNVFVTGTNATPYTVGGWQHVVVTCNNTDLKVYVNGTVTSNVASGTLGGFQLSSLGYSYYYGAWETNGYMRGKLADPRIYNVALTPTEVAQLAAGTDVTRGLVSRWKFDDNWSEGVSNDDPIVALESRSGNQIYTQPTSSKRPLYIEGPPESIQFDGTNDYLSSSNVITAESGVFAANCYFPSGDYSIISQSKAGSASYYFDIGVSDGIVQVKHENNDSETLVYGETDISNDWHCVVVTSDGSNYGIRVDQHQESLTGDNDGHWFGNLDQKDTLTLGANIIDSTDTPASGNISDVVIFNNPISSGYLMGLEKNMMKIGGFYNG
jgi:hypothetical protein